MRRGWWCSVASGVGSGLWQISAQLVYICSGGDVAEGNGGQRRQRVGQCRVMVAVGREVWCWWSWLSSGGGAC